MLFAIISYGMLVFRKHNTIFFSLPRSLHIPDWYWRDVDGREIVLVVARSRDQVDITECKWNPDHFSIDAMKIFPTL
jgi:hypothetical protein